MGGKHKVANRTKNNARPSSSGRSAELLGSTIPQFVGFSGVKDSAFGFASLNTEDLDSSIDANFQLVLKKISKKDATTKLKGLQEFADLVKESDLEVVKALLPTWPRFYNSLATDADNRVREAAHSVHHQIVLKAKRNIAPFLKQIMAPWFISQYDTYAPAASIATQAFKDAFPPNKVQEAIIFCQEEILAYIYDNLMVQTASTLSNMKNASQEDADAKFERVQISCLLGYYLYLSQVPTVQIEKTSEQNNQIVSNPKFWKLAKHKVPQIRSAWYKVLTGICMKAQFLTVGKEANIIGAVFSNVDEYDPTVLPHVWECVLLSMSSIEHWWSFINVEKVFLPKLWKILKLGGQGNASVIFPNLLPLLSHLPPNLDKNTFFENFFEHLKSGFKQKQVIASRSETVAVAEALIECLQFIILKNQSNEPLCKNLIQSHIIATIEWCLLEKQECQKNIFNQVSSLVQYWSRNGKEENYAKYFEFFFENIFELLKSTLYNYKEIRPYNVSEVTLKHMEFLQSLRHVAKQKKQNKVKFEDLEGNTQNSDVEVTNSNELYLERLNYVVFDICLEYFKYVDSNKNKDLLEHLCTLIVDFDTEKFFINLNKKLKNQKENTSLVDIFDEFLYKWLKSYSLCSKHVIDLIFLLYDYLNEEERKKVISAISEVKSQECLSWCVAKSLSHPYNNDELIKNWLRSDQVSSFIVSIAEKEITDEATPELSVLFKLALTENRNGELYVKQEAIMEIINKLVEATLNKVDNQLTLDTCSSLASYIAAIVYTESLLLNYEDKLLLALFKLSCKHNFDPEIISSETIYEVNSAWQDTVSLLAKELDKSEFTKLIEKFAIIIEEEFNLACFDPGHLEHLIGVIVNFSRALYKSLPLQMNEYLDIVLERKFVIKLRDEITNISKLGEYVKGNLCSPYQEVSTEEEMFLESDLLKYFVWSYLKLCIFSNKLEEELIDEYSDDEDIEENKIIIETLSEAGSILSQIVYDLSLSKSVLENYKNIKYYNEILNNYTSIKLKLKSLLDNLHDDYTKDLKEFLKKKAGESAWFWCLALYLLHTEIVPADLLKCYEEVIKSIQTESKLAALQLTQIFGQYISYDQIERKFEGIECVIVLRSLCHCEEIDVQIAEGFSKIEGFRNTNTSQFFLDSANITWNKCQEILESIRLCSALINNKIASLNRRHWDFGVLSLCQWAANCLKARAHYEKPQIQAIFAAAVDLFVSTDKQIKKMKETEVTNSFVDEWEDVLIDEIHADLCQLWLFLAEQFENKPYKNVVANLPFIAGFGKVLDSVYHVFLFKLNENMPKWTKFLKRSCSLILHSVPTLQLWGHKMLLSLVPGLVKLDAGAVDTNTPHRKGLIFEQFKEKLVQTHGIVNSMLLEFKLGEDSCTVKPSTDSYTYTLAYLLLWDVLLSLCDKSAADLRFQYADWLRNEELLKHFLNNAFRLMPVEILHYSEGKSKSLMDLFLIKPDLEVGVHCSSETIEKLVCWLYASTLAELPFLVRQWWISIETRVAQVVERVTATYVSPHLCNQELQNVTQHQTKFKNMVVKVVPSVREVIAVYTVDEAQMELVITLPQNYPLGGIEVDCSKQIGGTSFRQWLLQLRKCLLHQNGRIWDGLSFWNNTLDKKFDGVEECYICFAVLHPGTCQLPKLSCQTCKKKFHTVCLYKWFSTSNKSSCPICRNLF